MFDKLGDLLSEALEKGEIPKTVQSKESSPSSTKSETIQQTFSDFSFIQDQNKSSETIKATVSPSPKIPADVKTAMAFIQIPKEADFESAKKIYREKLMYYHPDRRNDNPVLQKVAKEKTARLLKEWEIIEKWYDSQKN